MSYFVRRRVLKVDAASHCKPVKLLSSDSLGIISLEGNSQSPRQEEEKVSNANVLSAFLPRGLTIPKSMFTLLISVLLLVPCVWLPQIESFDLCSHIYNAWLARLIAEQRVPGLYMVPQSTNILFDTWLTLLMKQFGPVLAQRIAVGASVLLFFWSLFTFIKVVSGRPPWFLAPLLAVLHMAEFFITVFLTSIYPWHLHSLH